MHKITLLIVLSFNLCFSSQNIDITHISRQAQDSQEGLGKNSIDYSDSDDDFFIEVESIYDPTDGEMLDEKNMMGGE